MKSFAIDTETTGLDINRGVAPYLIGICDENGEVERFEFRVSQYTRVIQWDEAECMRLYRYLMDRRKATWFWWNKPFDLKMLASIPVFGCKRVNGAVGRNMIEEAHPHRNPLTSDLLAEINSNSHDGLVMAHQWNAEEKHGLKEFGIKHLDIGDDDESVLVEYAKAAVSRAKRLQWRVASKRVFPSMRKEFYKSDYWLCRDEYAEALGFDPGDNYHESGERLDHYYLGWDCRRTWLAGDKLLGTIQADPVQERAYEEIHRPCGTVIVAQSCVPIGVREVEAKGLLKTYQEEKQTHFNRLTALIGRDYDPALAEQKQEILYDRFGIEPFRLTKAGQKSVDKFVMKEIIKNKKGLYEKKVIRAAVDMMAGNKYATHERYTESYIRESASDHVRGLLLYLGLNQTGTRTGRLSSGGLGVNGQNIATGKEGVDKKHPTAWDEFLIAKGELFKLRGLFGPPKGREWIIADYRQLQLFIFAHACGDRQMVEYLEAGGDAHDYVARMIFDLTDEEKPDEGQRRVAKVINFGFIFGAQERRLERESGIGGLYSLLRKRIPFGVKFLDATKRLARKQGYVETLGGFKVWTPENKINAAVCDIVQGTEAEIVKRAMVKSYFEQKLSIAIQVHDELVFEGPVGWHKWGAKRVHEAMIGAGKEWDMNLGVKMELVEDGGKWNAPSRVLVV